MSIRELQYAIQQAIDEKGVADYASIKIIPNKDNDLELFACENRIEQGKHIVQYTLLGKI